MPDATAIIAHIGSKIDLLESGAHIVVQVIHDNYAFSKHIEQPGSNYASHADYASY
jgi:hypothetical protein